MILSEWMCIATLFRLIMSSLVEPSSLWHCAFLHPVFDHMLHFDIQVADYMHLISHIFVETYCHVKLELPMFSIISITNLLEDHVWATLSLSPPPLLEARCQMAFQSSLHHLCSSLVPQPSHPLHSSQYLSLMLPR